MEKELALQQSVTRQFAPVAAQQIANVSDYLGNTRNYQKVAGLKADWEQQLAQAQTPEQQAELQQNIAAANQYLSEHQAAYDLWKEGGIGRSLLHAGSGALLTGGADGALASGSTALAAPYLNEISGKLGGGGKVLFDTLSGAAIGLATGGNTGAMAAGANTDWNNRQLHNHEISKIKQIAGEFAAQNNISLQEAEIRLLVEAMRQVDRTYANQHAKADGAAAQFLRYHTGSFNDETGESILEFAPSGYYNDPRKFAEQTGYMTERLIIRDSPTSQPIRGTSYLRLSSDDIKAMGRGLIGKDLPREKSNIRGYVRGITKSVLGNAWYMQGTGAEYEMPVGVFHDNQYERKDRFELTSRQEAQGALGFTAASFIVPIAVGKGVPLLRTSHAWLTEARIPRFPFGRFGKTSNHHLTNIPRTMQMIDGEMIGNNRPPTPNLSQYNNVPSNFYRNVLRHNTQRGVRNSRTRSISGAHQHNAFLQSIRDTGSRILGQPRTDPRYPGLIEYRYQIPALDAANNPTGKFKSPAPPKTTYDPTIISDSRMAEMSTKAASQAQRIFHNNPSIREATVSVDGYLFRATKDSVTGSVNNAFPIIP